jgi:hypothetical protein
MAFVLADRVRDTTTTTGTGTVTLSGTAPTGYQTFGAGIGNGNNTYYTINADSQWEVGIGTYTASGTTLSRNTVLASSNGGALVDFAIGIKDVFCDYPAEKAVTDIYGTALAATTAANIGGGAAGSIPYQTAANTTSLLAAGTGVLIGGTTPSYTASPSLTQVTVAGDPSTALQVATKQYVDGLVSSGITYHEPVKYEVPNTTGNLNALYNQPGGAGNGVGATLTNNGTKAAFAPDGPTASVGDRILVYNQTSAFQNGIYTVTTVGTPDPGGTNWVLTRSTDADTYGLKEVEALGNGDSFFVTSGDTGAGETYVCNTTGTITFGTTAITFVQVSDATLYTAGNGLQLTSGTVFSLIAPVTTVNGGTGLTAFTSGGAVYATSTSALTTGTLPATAGGTGFASYTTGDLLYASSSTALSALADIATGNALISGGVGTAPSYGKIGLTTHISGTLAVGNGGTGATTLTGYLVGNGTSAFTATATIPTSALSGTISLTTQVSGTLGAGNGGTGLSSYTVGDILYASGTTALSSLADVATGNALISGGVSVAPSWGKIGLTTHVSGTLPVANGGSGATTLTGYLKGNGTSAFTASATIPAGDITGAALTKADDTNVTLTLGGSPSTALLAATSITAGWTGQLAVSRGGTGNSTLTANGILLGNGVSPLTATAVGTTGQVLVGNTGAAPSWSTLSGIGVTSFSAGTTGLTPSSATTGVVTLAGTLNVANGGTGATTLSSGYLLKGNGTSAVSASVVYDDGTNAGVGTTSLGAKWDVKSQINVTSPSSISMNAVRASNFGYSTGYSALIIGSTSGNNTPCINVDPIANPSGSFSGLGDEVMFRNGAYFISPNSANTAYNQYLRLIDGYVQFTNSARAPIFYDSDNTSFYLDPNSTSVLSVVRAATIQHSSGNTAIVLNSGTWTQFCDPNGGTKLWLGGTADPNNYYNANIHYFRNTGSGTTMTIDSAGTVIATADMRAPIFYDSNNTGFYIDPAGTSNINTLNGNGKQMFTTADSYLRMNEAAGFTSGIWMGNSSFGGGAGTIHLGSAGDPALSRIRIIGGTYNGSTVITLNGADGVIYATKTGANNTPAIQIRGGNFGYPRFQTYGLDADANAWMGLGTDMGGGPYEHSVYFPNGTGGTAGNGRLSIGDYNGTTYNARLWVYTTYTQINNSARSPIFYDSDNTARYFDGTTGINFTTGSSSRVTVYSDDSGFHVANSEGVGGDVRLGAAYNLPGLYNNPNLYLQSESGIYFHIGNAQKGYFDSSSNLFANGSMRAPIFYDSNNTAYYVDPAGTSLTSIMAVGTGLAVFDIAAVASDPYGLVGVTRRTDANYSYYGLTRAGQLGMGMGIDTSNIFWVGSTSGGYAATRTSVYFQTNTSGDVTASSSFRAPIFYDSNNTGYYLNPESTSVLYEAATYYLRNIEDVAVNHEYGIYFSNSRSTAYAIFREAGAWTHPYPDLRIAFHTGIKMGANPGYGGMKFYTDYDMSSQVMSINNGSDPLGGSNVYVNNSLQAGSSLRAPIFYDSDNTGYYLNPASTSYINALNIGPSANGVSYLNINGYNAYGGTGYLGFLTLYNTYSSATNPQQFWRLNAAGGFEIVNSPYNAVLFTFTQGGDFTAAGNVTAYSDRKLKTDFEPITNAVSKVLQLNGVTFARIDKDDKTMRYAGLVAQDVEKVLPEAVQKNDTMSYGEILSVDYNATIALLVEAIKELTNKVKALEAKEQ